MIRFAPQAVTLPITTRRKEQAVAPVTQPDADADVPASSGLLLLPELEAPATKRSGKPRGPRKPKANTIAEDAAGQLDLNVSSLTSGTIGSAEAITG